MEDYSDIPIVDPELVGAPIIEPPEIRKKAKRPKKAEKLDTSTLTELEGTLGITPENIQSMLGAKGPVLTDNYRYHKRPSQAERVTQPQEPIRITGPAPAKRKVIEQKPTPRRRGQDLGKDLMEEQGPPPIEQPGWGQHSFSLLARPALEAIPRTVEAGSEMVDAIAYGLGRLEGGTPEEVAQRQTRITPYVKSLSTPVRRFVRGVTPIDPEKAGYATSEALGTLGSGLGFMASGMAGKALGIPSKIVTGIMGAGLNISDVLEEADQLKASPDKRATLTFLAGATGLTEIVGMGDIVDKFGLRQLYQDRVKDILKDVGQEGLQQWMNNVSMIITKVDPDRPQSKDVIKSALLGGFASGVFSGVGIGYEKFQEHQQEKQLDKATRQVFSNLGMGDPRQIGVIQGGKSTAEHIMGTAKEPDNPVHTQLRQKVQETHKELSALLDKQIARQNQLQAKAIEAWSNGSGTFEATRDKIEEEDPELNEINKQYEVAYFNWMKASREAAREGIYERQGEQIDPNYDPATDELAFDVMPGMTEGQAPYLRAPAWFLQLVSPRNEAINTPLDYIEDMKEDVRLYAPTVQHAQTAIAALDDLVQQSQEAGLGYAAITGTGRGEEKTRGFIEHEVWHTAQREGLMPDQKWLENHPLIQKVGQDQGLLDRLFPRMSRAKQLQHLAMELSTYTIEGAPRKLGITPNEGLDFTVDYLNHIRDQHGQQGLDKFKKIIRLRPEMQGMFEMADAVNRNDQQAARATSRPDSPRYGGAHRTSPAKTPLELHGKDVLGTREDLGRDEAPEPLAVGDKVRLKFPGEDDPRLDVEYTVDRIVPDEDGDVYEDLVYLRGPDGDRWFRRAYLINADKAARTKRVTTPPALPPVTISAEENMTLPEQPTEPQGLHEGTADDTIGEVRQFLRDYVGKNGKLPTSSKNTFLGKIFQAALARGYPPSTSTLEVAMMLAEQRTKEDARSLFNTFFPEGGAPPLSIATQLDNAIAQSGEGDAISDHFRNILKTAVAQNGTLPQAYKHLPVYSAFEIMAGAGFPRTVDTLDMVIDEFNRGVNVKVQQSNIRRQAKQAIESMQVGKSPIYRVGDTVKLRDKEGEPLTDDFSILEFGADEEGPWIKIQRHDDGGSTIVRFEDLARSDKRERRDVDEEGPPSGPPQGPQIPQGPEGNYPPIMVDRMSNTYQRAVDRAFFDMLKRGGVELQNDRRVFLQVVDAMQDGKISGQQFDEALAANNMTVEDFIKEYAVTVHEAAMTLNELSRIKLKYGRIIKNNPELAARFMAQGTPGTPGYRPGVSGQSASTSGAPPGSSAAALAGAAGFLSVQNQIDILMEEMDDTILSKNAWQRVGSLIRMHMLSDIRTAIVNAYVTTGRIPLAAVTHGMGAYMYTMYNNRNSGRTLLQRSQEARLNSLRAMKISQEVLLAIKPTELWQARKGKDNRTAGVHHDYDLMMDQMLKQFPDLKGRLLAPGVGPEKPQEVTNQIRDVKNLISKIGDIPSREKALKNLQKYEKRFESNQNNIIKRFYLSKHEWIMDKVCAPMRWQELIFRQPMFFAYLNYKLEQNGMNLQDLLATKQLAKIPKAILDEAIDESLDFTYSYMPHKDGPFYEKWANGLIKTVNDMGPLSALAGAAFPRAVYNGVKFTIEYSPMGMLPTLIKLFKPKEIQDPTLPITYPVNQMTERDFQQFSKGIVGTMLFGTAAAMIYGGLIGDEWWKIKVPFGSHFTDSGNPLYIDARKYQPLVTFLRLADLSMRMGASLTGSDAFGRQRGELDVGKEIREIITGLRDFPGVEDTVSGFFEMWDDQKTGTWEKSRTSVGMGFSWVTRPLINIRDLVGVFMDEEQKQKDLKGTGFMGPMIDNIPWVRSWVLENKAEPNRSPVETAFAPATSFGLGTKLVEGENFAGREWRRLGILNKSFLPPDPDAKINRAQNEIFFQMLDPIAKSLENDPIYAQSSDKEKAMIWDLVIGGDKGVATQASEYAEYANPEERERRRLQRESEMREKTRKATGFDKAIQEK